MYLDHLPTLQLTDFLKNFFPGVYQAELGSPHLPDAQGLGRRSNANKYRGVYEYKCGEKFWPNLNLFFSH